MDMLCWYTPQEVSAGVRRHHQQTHRKQTTRNHDMPEHFAWLATGLARETIPLRAELRSNLSDRGVGLEFPQPSSTAWGTGLETQLVVTGSHYDGDHNHEFHLRIDGFWLDVSRLIEFRDFIRSWVESPLESLVASALDGEYVLTKDVGQRLAFRFGDRPGVISDSKPVVSVEYSVASLSGTFVFVTDQSCISLFSADLASIITVVAG